MDGKTLIRYLEQLAPPYLAVDHDRVGFQVGSLEEEVSGVLVTLEVTDAVVEEAIANGANWIFSHHALLFRPLADLRTDQPKGRLLAKLLQHRIQVYNAHTNLDTVSHGVNDVLAEELGLQQTKILLPHGQEQLLKLVVFVPKTHLTEVRQAITDSGAGAIGNYTHCTFSSEGTGTFLPGENTTPFIGEQGKLEEVAEYRLETIFPKSIQSQVLQAMIQAHPYEEVAYDLYPLVKSVPYGMGKIGKLSQPMRLEQFIQYVKQVYELSHVRVVGDVTTEIRNVALLGGSGSRYVDEAQRQGADVYLTGDIDYHTAQDALAAGMCLIDIGHATEQRVVPSICRQLESSIGDRVKIIASQIEMNPFQIW
jgi:dinuclear metal center YbgI/SA1388 family protein